MHWTNAAVRPRSARARLALRLAKQIATSDLMLNLAFFAEKIDQRQSIKLVLNWARLLRRAWDGLL